MNATAVRAGLVAILAGATVLASPAEAATSFGQSTAVCSSGDFGGRFTLRWDVSGGYYHPIGSITSSGPYIGDSGTQLLRISYRDGVTVRTVYTRLSPTTGQEHSETLPSGINVPVGSYATASTKFDNGTASCIATVLIR